MNAFEKNITQMYSSRGEIWLKDLPMLVRGLATHWHLSDLKPVNNLSYNYVLTGMQQCLPVILKLSLDREGLQREALTLRAFEGHGCVRVLADHEGALLLERAMPGTPLKSYFPDRDVEAIRIACGVIEKLQQAPRPLADQFPSLSHWLAILDQDWNMPEFYLPTARQLRDQLLASSTETQLLHGDLHHDNILQNGDQWWVIDPKGVMGDPLVDITGCLLREPLAELLKQPHHEALLDNRIKIISDYFKIEPLKLLQWAFVFSVMASCWALEDQQDPKPFYQFISLLDSKMRRLPT